MGVVAYYARMNESDVNALKLDPEQYWQLDEMPWDLTKAVDSGASECLYIDKDWQVLSWLCSARGRAEERYQAALVQMDLRVNDEGLSGAGEFKAALAREAEAMGFPYVDPRELPADPVLKAIQGRRHGDDGPTVSNLGLAASAFSPQEVQLLATALNGLDEAWLRERFDVGEMEALALPSDCEATELDEFYLPQLERLRALYNRAASAGQHVVVVRS
jgi:hypothetical protein